MIAAFLGGMAGDKTGKLIQRVNNRRYSGFGVQVFQPNNSLRKGIESDVLCARGVVTDIPLNPFDPEDPLSILNRIKSGVSYVVLPEYHMIKGNLATGNTAIVLVRKIVASGRRVILDGLKLDYGGKPFKNILELIAEGVHIESCYGVCTHKEFKGDELVGCSLPGTHSQLYIDEVIVPYTGPELRSGDVTKGKVSYRPKCIRHFIYPENAEGYEDQGILINVRRRSI
ncbi:MAG: hypothetical protein ISS01_02025 [Nanoarchaeota archaeon]|nr:hypothetical protein [Nanoarchaeota archaeon]